MLLVPTVLLLFAGLTLGGLIFRRRHPSVARAAFTVAAWIAWAVAAAVATLWASGVEAGTEDHAARGGMVMLGLAAYPIPTFVAIARRHHNTPAIAVLNLALGWTLFGWAGALVWALVRARSTVSAAGMTLCALAVAAGDVAAQPLRLGEILSADGSTIHRWSSGEIESLELEDDPFLDEPITISADGTVLAVLGQLLVRVNLEQRDVHEVGEIPGEAPTFVDLEMLSETEAIVVDRNNDRLTGIRIDTGATRTITQGGFLDLVESVAVEPSGMLLVQNSSLLYRVNPANGAQALLHPLLVEDADQIELEPGGESLLVVGSDDTSMYRVRLSDGEASPVAAGAFSDVKFAPDGRLFAVRLPEFAGPELVEIVEGEPQPIGSLGLFGYQIAISPVPEPDGATVAALLALAVLASRPHAAAPLGGSATSETRSRASRT